MSDAVCLIGYAKVNLALGIEGVKGGFHNLDSVMATIDIFDQLSMRKRDDDQIVVRYLTGESYPNDNAYKVAKAVKERYGFGGVDIIISKGVPEGTGLGGSAVDGATIVRGYEKLYDVEIADNDFLVKLGGDIPFLKRGGCAVVKGRGEIITPVELPKMHLVLVYGAPSISTQEVFKKYDQVGGEGGKSSDFLKDFVPFNALERSAVQIEPTIKKSRDVLENAGFTRIVMTGSGSGYIALELEENEFNTKVERAKKLANEYGLKVRTLEIIKELS